MNCNIDSRKHLALDEWHMVAFPGVTAQDVGCVSGNNSRPFRGTRVAGRDCWPLPMNRHAGPCHAIVTEGEP
jgi:hypothetical protein